MLVNSVYITFAFKNLILEKKKINENLGFESASSLAKFIKILIKFDFQRKLHLKKSLQVEEISSCLFSFFFLL